MSRLPHIRTVLDRLRLRLFPERQLYFRANGVVRFVSFSPRVQVVSCLAALICTGWVVMASVNYLTRDTVLEAKDRQIEDMAKAYGALDAELERLQNDVRTTADRLRARQEYLSQIVDDSSIEGPEVAPTTDTTPAADTKDTTDAETESMDGSSLSEQDGSPSEQGGESVGALAGFFSRFSGNRDDDDTALSVNDLEADLQELNERQMVIARRLLDLTQQEIAVLETVLDRTGVSKDDVLAMAANHQESLGQGGPLIDENDFLLLAITADNADDPVLYLHQKQGELAALETVLANMPVIKPVNHYYISSLFGGRSDPVTHGRAVHYGIDMAGWPGTEIYTTGSGLVTHSDWNGAYGKFVEVDHGNGFKTRYGHMRKLNVRKGQRVERGQVIGQLGNTGRSTGPHLHYEVWFADTPLNPMNFFKAKDDVFKINQRQQQSL